MRNNYGNGSANSSASGLRPHGGKGLQAVASLGPEHLGYLLQRYFDIIIPLESHRLIIDGITRGI